MICMGLCAWFLPFQGQLGFLMSPDLWKHLALPFVVCMVGTLAALYLLYEYVEWPQQEFMEARGWPDWLCVALSYMLIPIEAAVLNLVLFALLFGQVTNQIQEAVLEARGVDRKLVELCGVDVLTDGGFFTGLCNNMVFLFLQLFCMVATFQLHAVPGLGQILWVALSGWVRPWELVAEKLPLIGYRHCGSQTCHLITHFFSYVTFGFVAFMLELCPFVNFFTIAGNAYASALLFEGFVDEGRIGPDYLPASNNKPNNWNNLDNYLPVSNKAGNNKKGVPRKHGNEELPKSNSRNLKGARQMAREPSNQLSRSNTSKSASSGSSLFSAAFSVFS